jgi:hypothetical protein
MGLDPISPISPSHWPAISTAGQILRRHGLVVPRKTRHRTPPYTQPLAHATRPNDVWTADHKGSFLNPWGQSMTIDIYSHLISAS